MLLCLNKTAGNRQWQIVFIIEIWIELLKITNIWCLQELCCDGVIFENFGDDGKSGACCNLAETNRTVSFDTRCYRCKKGELEPLYDCAFEVKHYISMWNWLFHVFLNEKSISEESVSCNKNKKMDVNYFWWQAS